MLTTRMMSQAAWLGAFLKLGRPHFLLGGLVLFGLGAALAAVSGADIDWRRYFWGQSLVTATQWMTHANDYFDLAADRANTTPTRWSGGSRVLVRGGVAPRAALVASLVLAVAALAALGVLAAHPATPPWTAPIGLLILSLSWCYSAPPLRLLRRGLGEATTALVVTLLTPLLGFYLQRGAIEPVLFLACFPLCCLQFAMLLTIELPDAAGDATQGKRTLVVRWGPEWAAHRAVALLGLAFGSLPLLFLLGLPLPVAGFAALLAPLAVWQAVSLTRGAYRDSQRWEGLALRSVLLVFATIGAQLTGAVLTAASR
jgi:1,4-dihydroxy-2-naphthoate polyprenyltransferase